MNYIVYYDNESQIYGSASKEIALETPPPPGVPLEEKHVAFITYQPDNKALTVHFLPDEEVRSADIKEKEKREKKSE